MTGRSPAAVGPGDSALVALAARVRPAFRCLLAALLVTPVWTWTAWAAEPAAPFRLCADPDNLPFSSSDAKTPGIYVELGRQIADQLGRPFQPVWAPTYVAKREVRTTLLAGQCDGFIGLPNDPDFMGPRLIFSKPILRLGYALALRHDMTVTSLSDLAGRRVAVQFDSPPQNLLATRADIQSVTTMTPEEAMNDLAQGKADAAFTWGPSAGWINQSALHGAYQVLPVEGEHMQWQSAIAFQSRQTALRDQVDQALTALASSIDALMNKYGFPTATPIRLAQAGNATQPATPAADPTVGDNTSPQPSPATSSAPTAQTTAAAGDAEAIAAGHKLFNSNCAHCHGPDAIQGERRINLRLLHHRYGDRMDEVFQTTVHQGRVTKGMPKWGGILSDDQFNKILAYLHSLQEP
jgi:polar amino acid transport system substrate-binding protein